MNGIAALPRAGEFLLTGKTWRNIYHVRLTSASRPPARIQTLPASAPGEISP
jgi:Glutamine cyclotransferase